MTNGKYTVKKAEVVLAALADGSSITKSMAALGLPRHQYYHWREDFPEFGEAADHAIESGTDRLEDVAHDRAITQSDTLLIFMLKARRREKYGDKWLGELTGKDGAPFTIVIGQRPDGPQ